MFKTGFVKLGIFILREERMKKKLFVFLLLHILHLKTFGIGTCT